MKTSSGSSFSFLKKKTETHGHLAPVAWTYKSKKMRPRANSTRKLGHFHDVPYAGDSTRPPRFSADDFCNLNTILPVRSRPITSNIDGDDMTHPAVPDEDHQRHAEGLGKLINAFNPAIVIDSAQHSKLPLESVMELTPQNQYVQPCCSACRTEDAAQWRRGPKGRRLLCSDCADAYPPRRRKRREVVNTISAQSSSENTGYLSVRSLQKW